MVHVRRFIVSALGVATVSIAFTGCNNSNPPATSAAKTDPVKEGQNKPNGTAKTDGEHGHKPSAHGGILVAVGSDSYHAEAVFEKGGILRLYTLGQNEAIVLEVEALPITGYVKVEGGMESESFVLAPKPQPGDKPGMTSQFVGHLPKEMAGKKVEVTIPSIRIGNERFRIAFKSVPDAGEHGMPAKVADEDEKKLYLTPGGKYTEADIKANGNVTASAKFKGLKAEHDLKPKTGDLICPITLTKANAKFSWVIDGKTYQFCCPPCVDEFVALAKEKPDEIKPPEFYRQK
jgi:YHS domain-containing protein